MLDAGMLFYNPYHDPHSGQFTGPGGGGSGGGGKGTYRSVGDRAQSHRDAARAARAGVAKSDSPHERNLLRQLARMHDAASTYRGADRAKMERAIRSKTEELRAHRHQRSEQEKQTKSQQRDEQRKAREQERYKHSREGNELAIARGYLRQGQGLKGKGASALRRASLHLTVLHQNAGRAKGEDLKQIRAKIKEAEKAYNQAQKTYNQAHQSSQKHSETIRYTYSRPIRLDETQPGADGFVRKWIMMLPLGKYEHPEHGTLAINTKLLDELIANFRNRVRQIDIALDVDHKGAQGDTRASGWLEDVQQRPAQGDTPAGLWGLVKWTPYGARLLKDEEYKYGSIEFGPYKDPESGKEYKNVIISCTLTNRPFMKSMPAITLMETSTTPWSHIDKACLPDSCFLDPKNRRLPVYEGVGPKVNGKYTQRGALNLNAVHAALAAVNGAHTGQAMTGLPAGTQAKLQRWSQMYQKHMEGLSNMTKKLMGGNGSKAGPVGSRSAKVADYDAEDIDDATAFADGDDEEDTMMADDEEGDAYDEADGDGEDEPDGDEEDVPPSKGKQGKGKFAPRNFAKGGKKMAETVTLAEHQEALRRLAELEYRNYETGIEKMFGEWRSGRLITLTGNHSVKSATRDPRGGKPVARRTLYALTPKAEAKIKAFMGDVGYTLSENRRNQFLDVVQTLLSDGLVELGARGGSFDQEQRRTLRGGSFRMTDGEANEAELQQLAEQFAAADNKSLMQVTLAEREQYYIRAYAAQQGA